MLWSLAIASGLTVIAILYVRRSRSRPAFSVVSKASCVNDRPAPGSAEPYKDEAAEADRARSRAPDISPTITATLPVQPSGTTNATRWAVIALLTVLSSVAIYNAFLSYRIDRATNQLLAHSPQAAGPGAAAATQEQQRAWIGLSVSKVYPLTRVGGGFVISLQNVGRTPALQASVTDYVVIEDLHHLTGAQEATSHSPMSLGTLAPGSGFNTDVWFKTSPDALSGLSGGEIRAVNYAVVTYQDIFHRTHTTQSCFYWHGGLPAPLPCEGFNTLQ